MTAEIESLPGALVEDQDEAPIGVLTAIWADSANSKVKYLEVAASPESPEVQLVPVRNSRFDDYSRIVRVSFPFHLIQSAPSIRPGTELDTALEQRIGEHFGKEERDSTKREEGSLKRPVSEAKGEVGSQRPEAARRTMRRIAAPAAIQGAAEGVVEREENIPRIDNEADTFESIHPDLRRVWDRQRRSPTEL